MYVKKYEYSYVLNLMHFYSDTVLLFDSFKKLISYLIAKRQQNTHVIDSQIRLSK